MSDDRPYKIKRPARMEKYIISRVAGKAYIIFDRKMDTAYCTKCGRTYKVSDIEKDGEELRHNEIYNGCKCGKIATAKEKRYGRKNITEYGRILWFTKKKNITYAQLDEYDIDYSGEKPQVHFWESAQYKLSKKEQAYYKLWPGGNWLPRRWEKKKNIKVPEPQGMMGYAVVPKYYKTIVYSHSISNLGTDLEYANTSIAYQTGTGLDPYMLIGYITIFLKYQSIELLEKAGFVLIVREKSTGKGCKQINWRATDLRKILKLNRRELKEFKESDPRMITLEVYKKYRKKGLNITFRETGLLCNYDTDTNLERIAKYTDVEKAIHYLQEGNSKQKERDMSLGDYLDYLGDCKKLGYNMKDKKVIFPKNLYKEHMRTMKLVKIDESKKMEENFAKGQQSVYKRTKPFVDGEYLIRPAESPLELNEESSKLEHCVRSYAYKVSEGISAILFIRKVSTPEEPFYTLELSKDQKVVQCRGRRNCRMTQEVKNFVDKWTETVIERKKKRKKVA